MKLSIVIPVYNVEKYLEEAVLSLGNGNEDEVEIILVDDKSKDNSGNICDELAANDSRIKVIHKSENQGLSMSRNTGIDNASGDYIMFMDSDDKYRETDAVARILNAINETHYDMYFINMDKWWTTGTTAIVNKFNENDFCGLSLSEYLPFISGQRSFPASASLKIIKTECLRNNNLYFKQGIYCEDIEWFLRVLQIDKVSSVGYIDITYLYRQDNATSITSTISEKNIDDLITIIEDNATIIKDSNIESNIGRIIAFELMIGIKNISSAKDRKKEFISRIKKLMYLMKYSRDKRVKLTLFCAKLLGVQVTSRLLRLF